MKSSRILTASFLAAALAGGGVLAWALTGGERTGSHAPEMVVYKTETCGCCDDWVDHVREAGFAVTAHDISHQELNLKKHEAGLSPGLGSCHTAFVDGYSIEGHVPAADIHRLLDKRPDVAGLTVPGMPVGSPGMEMGDRKDPYDVLAFDRDGETRVFSSYHQ